MALTKVTGSVIKDSVSLSGNVSVGGTLTYQDVTNVDALGIGTFRTGIKVLAGQVDVGSNIKLGNAGVVTATSFVGSGANLTSLPAQATLSNNADNRVITGGSGVNLNGEANLTFDGTKLGIGQASPATLLNVKGNETAYSSNVAVGAILQMEDSAGRIAQFIAPGSAGDAGVGTKTNNHFQIFAGNSTKVFINVTDSSSTFYGDINILKGSGSASANLKLQSHDTANATSTIQFLARDNSNNNETCYIQANSGSTASVDLRFGTGSGEHLRLKSNSQLLHTRTDNVQRYDLEFRNTGGIGDGNYGGIHWTQGASGTTNLAAIEIAYANSGRPDIVFKNRQSGGTSISEALRINQDGNLKVGGFAHNRDLGGLSVQRLHIEGTDGGSSAIGLVNNQNSGGNAALYLAKSRGTSVNSNTILQNGDPMGSIVWCGADGNDMISQGAVITAEVDGAPGSNDMPGRLVFKTTADGAATATEKFRIGSDGKLYKSGNHFYPLVNYTEVATFSAASVSSSSYTDLRTIYSSYTPKKAGNLIVIHHQSQLWQGGNADGNGDAMWRLLRDEGSGFSEVVKNERIMGNMDGRNYTGGSGLARHHRTVHLMGSFTCNGNNFTLKTQGKVDHTNVSLQWYHNSENILQIWEYEKG